MRKDYRHGAADSNVKFNELLETADMEPQPSYFYCASDKKRNNGTVAGYDNALQTMCQTAWDRF